jgi:chemotaxis signal transduction protein
MNKFLVFKIGENQYCVNLDDTVHLFKKEDVRTISEYFGLKFGDSVTGIITQEEKIYLVFDLRTRICQEFTDNSSEIIIFTFIDNDVKIPVGFVIDKILEIVETDKETRLDFGGDEIDVINVGEAVYSVINLINYFTDNEKEIINKFTVKVNEQKNSKMDVSTKKNDFTKIRLKNKIIKVWKQKHQDELPKEEPKPEVNPKSDTQKVDKNPEEIKPVESEIQKEEVILEESKPVEKSLATQPKEDVKPEVDSKLETPKEEPKIEEVTKPPQEGTDITIREKKDKVMKALNANKIGLVDISKIKKKGVSDQKDLDEEKAKKIKKAIGANKIGLVDISKIKKTIPKEEKTNESKPTEEPKPKVAKEEANPELPTETQSQEVPTEPNTDVPNENLKKE